MCVPGLQDAHLVRDLGSKPKNTRSGKNRHRETCRELRNFESWIQNKGTPLVLCCFGPFPPCMPWTMWYARWVRAGHYLGSSSHACASHVSLCKVRQWELRRAADSPVGRSADGANLLLLHAAAAVQARGEARVRHTQRAQKVTALSAAPTCQQVAV